MEPIQLVHPPSDVLLGVSFVLVTFIRVSHNVQSLLQLACACDFILILIKVFFTLLLD